MNIFFSPLNTLQPGQVHKESNFWNNSDVGWVSSTLARGPLLGALCASQYNHHMLFVERDSYYLALFAAFDHERVLLAGKINYSSNSLSIQL
jgi:hypothetical protein